MFRHMSRCYVDLGRVRQTNPGKEPHGAGVHRPPDRSRPLDAEGEGGCPEPGLQRRARSAARNRPGLHRCSPSHRRRRRADRAHLAPALRPRGPADASDRRPGHPAHRGVQNALPRPPEPDRSPPGHRDRTRDSHDAAGRRAGGDRRHADRRPQDRAPPGAGRVGRRSKDGRGRNPARRRARRRRRVAWPPAPSPPDRGTARARGRRRPPLALLRLFPGSPRRGHALPAERRRSRDHRLRAARFVAPGRPRRRRRLRRWNARLLLHQRLPRALRLHREPAGRLAGGCGRAGARRDRRARAGARRGAEGAEIAAPVTTPGRGLVPGPVFLGAVVASVGGPLALVALYLPGAAGDGLAALGLTVTLALLVFLAPLAIWLGFSERVASAGGLAAFVEAAAGRRLARIQALIWIVSYSLYLPYTITYIVYDLLAPVFPGIVPYRGWLEVLLPVGIVLLALAPLRASLAVLGVVAVLGGLLYGHSGASRSAFSGHVSGPPVWRGVGAIALLFVCISLPLFFAAEVRGTNRTVRRGLAGGYGVVAAFLLFAAVPLATVAPFIANVDFPGVLVAEANSGRTSAV